MSDLRQKMRDILDNHAEESDQRLARRLLSSVTKSELLPIIEEEFWHLRRAEVQSRERQTLQRIMSQSPRKVKTLDQRSLELKEIYGDILDSEYACDLSGKRRKRFRHMTIEDHQSRIDMQLRQVNAINANIELHRNAIEEIRKAGVSCIDDVTKVRKRAA